MKRDWGQTFTAGGSDRAAGQSLSAHLIYIRAHQRPSATGSNMDLNRFNCHGSLVPPIYLLLTRDTPEALNPRPERTDVVRTQL